MTTTLGGCMTTNLRDRPGASCIAILNGYNPEAPFFHVEHALRSAFATEARYVVQVSTFLSQLRGSTVKTERERLTVWDRHAQAALILQFVERTLIDSELAAVMALYTIPMDRPLLERKVGACSALAVNLAKKAPHIPADYLADCVRKWSGLPQQHNEAWWQKRLGVGERTLKHWRYGRRARDAMGAYDWLGDMSARGVHLLSGPMFEAGLTKNPS